MLLARCEPTPSTARSSAANSDVAERGVRFDRPEQGLVQSPKQAPGRRPATRSPRTPNAHKPQQIHFKAPAAAAARPCPATDHSGGGGASEAAAWFAMAAVVSYCSKPPQISQLGALLC